jgi:hypothetical protein
MFAPSWRVLQGGAELWEEHDEDEDAFEVYVETLDSLESWEENGLTLSWDEGCIFVCNDFGRNHLHGLD